MKFGTRPYPLLITAAALASLRLEPDRGGGGGAPQSLEDKLKAARDEADASKGKVQSLTQELNDSKAEALKLQGQFDAATKEATKAQDELKTARAELQTTKDELAGTKTKLEAADKNVTRLETLCDVKGVDRKLAVPPQNPADDGGAAKDLFTQFQQLQKTNPGQAMAFFRKHEAEMREASALGA